MSVTDPSESQMISALRLKKAMWRQPGRPLNILMPRDVKTFVDICASLAREKGLNVPPGNHAARLTRMIRAKKTEFVVPSYIAAGIERTRARLGAQPAPWAARRIPVVQPQLAACG
jgi:hypothetical protein